MAKLILEVFDALRHGRLREFLSKHWRPENWFQPHVWVVLIIATAASCLFYYYVPNMPPVGSRFHVQ